MAHAYLVRETDGYETFALKVYTDHSAAHLAACRMSQAAYRTMAMVSCDNEGASVYTAIYVCGGHTTAWYPPDVEAW